MRRPAIAAAVLIASITAGGAFAGSEYQRVASVDIPLNGTAVSLPEMGENRTYLLDISGTFTCTIDGRTYDPIYRTDAAGAFRETHDLVVVEPAEAQRIELAAGDHTYVYELPTDENFVGESFVVRLNVDRLVDEFIRTPSEVRQSLSGGLKAALLVAPPAPNFALLIAAILVPLLIVGTVLGVMIQAARRTAERPYEDVEAMRRRIGRKCKEALAETEADQRLFDELRARVRSLRDGADELAGHVIAFREVKLRHNENEIEGEIVRLQEQLDKAQAADVVTRCREEIAAKQELLEFLKANEANESRYLLRLTQVETTVDALRLKIPQLRVHLAETGADESAVAEIDAELELLTKAIEETREHGVGPVS